jgi:hypothetical protein
MSVRLTSSAGTEAFEPPSSFLAAGRFLVKWGLGVRAVIPVSMVSDMVILLDIRVGLHCDLPQYIKLHNKPLLEEIVVCKFALFSLTYPSWVTFMHTIRVEGAHFTFSLNQPSMNLS